MVVDMGSPGASGVGYHPRVAGRKPGRDAGLRGPRAH